MSIAAPMPISTAGTMTLRDVSWETYESLRAADGNRGIRMTYDHGVLLLMSPSRLHERIAELLGQLILTWTEVNDIPRMSGGSTTMKSRLRAKGLEPDKCYYIQNEAIARQSDEFDAETDPPPDLAIEVDVSSISLAKMPVYAAFEVPEIWRWVDHRIEIHRLAGGEYVVTENSECLPGFPVDTALKFLDQRHELDETALIRQFRQACGRNSTSGN